jgi:hypothetical protein
MIKYYQWVPMILLILAFFYLLPRFMYRFLSKQSGLDLLNLADASINYMSVEKFDKRRRSLLYLANSIHFYSICNKSRRTKGGFGASSSIGSPVGSPILGASSSKPYLYNLICCHGKLNGSYLVVLYMITKLFYIANSIAQLFIMNIFLGFNYNSHGFHVLKDITKGIISNTNSLNAQRKAEAELAAKNFASQLNLNKPMSGGGGSSSQSILGPTVIFDTFDDPFTDGLNSGAGGNVYSGNYAETNHRYESIYSEPVQSNIMMHRYFPRESACDFRIRANIDSLVHNYTVQCVLPISKNSNYLIKIC